MPEEHSQRYVVVQGPGPSQASRRALVDTHSHRTVKGYRSHQLAITDAAFLNQRPVTWTW
jgi:hypothetical protein